MSEARDSAAKAWKAITQSRHLARQMALAEKGAMKQGRRLWGFDGRGEGLVDYEEHNAFPVITYLSRLYAAYQGKRVLRVVDIFTSHTDPLARAADGEFEDKGLPAGSIKGFSCGLSFMGSPQERADALEAGVTFIEGDIFNPSSRVFPQLDEWLTYDDGDQQMTDTIDFVVSRLGVGDITFPNQPAFQLHRLIGEFYNRGSEVMICVVQLPRSLDDDMRRYLHVLESDYGIQNVLRTFQENQQNASDNTYGRSLMLLRNMQSIPRWPTFREVLGKMTA